MNPRVELPPIPFIDVAAQRRRLGAAIDTAVTRVLDHCQFILGPEVRAFEAELAAFSGAKHAVTCASGTDALVLPLRARGIGPGDAVICPSFTFCATAEVAVLVGATPVFVDVDADTFNMNPKTIAGAIKAAKAAGLTPKAIIPVDLFGLPADQAAIRAIADAEGLFVIDDAAQGFGGSINGSRLGTFAHATSTSFFPAKPLGCYGDGGAVMTDDGELAEIDAQRACARAGQRQVRQRPHRARLAPRHHPGGGAARKAEDLPRRDRGPQRRRAPLCGRPGDVVTVPTVPDGYVSVWAQYTIRLPAGRREAFAAALKADGIPTAIYYPIPLHRQQAYKQYPVAEGGLPVSEQLAGEVISLPMHAYLDAATQGRIIEAVRRAL